MTFGDFCKDSIPSKSWCWDKPSRDKHRTEVDEGDTMTFSSDERLYLGFIQLNYSNTYMEKHTHTRSTTPEELSHQPGAYHDPDGDYIL